MKRPKKLLPMPIFFSIIVFFILLITMFLTSMMILCIVHIFNISGKNPLFIIFTFAIISIVIGTFFSKLISHHAFHSFIEISEATQEVAKGNFDVCLDENIPIKEAKNMAQNFNKMTKELSQTEIFRNDFISNVSHEFKTPLAAIEGYATLLQNKNISEEKRDLYIQKIIFNTKRLSKLTGNILELSFLEHQSIESGIITFSLDEQIRECILSLEEKWSNKNLNLEINLEEITYRGNKELLYDVWENLIANAIKFTQDHGTIFIKAKENNNKIEISIEDTGIGIKEDEIPRIFEKFYQAESSHSNEGNGLGLALVKQIVELHQGEIKVTSTPQKGASFKIYL